VTRNEATFQFSKEIRFVLEATAPAEIEEVTLFYRLAGNRVTGRAYPEFQPGVDIRAEWVLELQPGQLAPGSEITFYWELSPAGGGPPLRTDTASILYQDDRFDWRESTERQVHVYTYSATKGPALLQAALDSLDQLQQEIGVTLDAPV